MKHYALIGDPVSHSLSPIIYNTLFAHYGIDAHFDVLCIPKGALDTVPAMGLSGFACTMPHKHDILPLLSRITPEAERMGSVNIVRADDDGLYGCSTDGAGLLRAIINAGGNICGANITIIGTGGAARAAVFSLLPHTKHITLAGRNAMALKSLCNEAGLCRGYEDIFSTDLSHCDILINATPQGMQGQAPFPCLSFINELPRTALVCDMVYAPHDTLLLQAACRRELGVMNGIAMLIEQACLAFEFWTGIAPDHKLLSKL
ncbi:MAG: shikimate dehydrogenase [Clostridia bacterium]